MPTVTKSPTQNELGNTTGWVNPNNAHADDAAYATGTVVNTTSWKTYGFEDDIPAGSIISAVKVKPKGYNTAPGADLVGCWVSWDGGVTWGPWHQIAFTASESQLTIDVSGDTAWTRDKLNNANFKVKVEFELGGCFAPDTEVALWNDDLEKPPKLKKIQSVKEGDEIIGWNREKRDFEKAVVTKLEEHEGDFEILHIICRIPEELYEYAKERAPDRVKHGPYKDIAVTGNHPVRTFNRGAVRADELKVGEDYLWGCFGVEHKIQPILIEEIRRFWVKKVYDLQCTSEFFFKHYLMLVEVK